ncbi:MAG: Tab2/Atab2 family RNA-binding protein [Leptolyngbya sp.]|nr:Tab2/Atab2 family RNA-binding protein [Leptolyngbya sp.]
MTVCQPVWQLDLHRPPLTDAQGDPLWEFLACTADLGFCYEAQISQGQVTADWVTDQLRAAMDQAGYAPSQVQVFRPQALSLLTLAADRLGLITLPTRRTPALHQWLRQKAQALAQGGNPLGQTYDPLSIDAPPPLPLADHLWGDRWGFVTLAAGDFERTFPHEPIPIVQLPPAWLPSQVGLASTTPIPGIVIEGGRQAMALAQWVQSVNPATLRYLPGDPDGLILEAGLWDRWVMTTFADGTMAQAGQQFEQRKGASQGLHFLLIRPDDSGLTYTGLWLLLDDGPTRRSAAGP